MRVEKLIIEASVLDAKLRVFLGKRNLAVDT